MFWASLNLTSDSSLVKILFYKQEFSCNLSLCIGVYFDKLVVTVDRYLLLELRENEAADQSHGDVVSVAHEHEASSEVNPTKTHFLFTSNYYQL